MSKFVSNAQTRWTRERGRSDAELHLLDGGHWLLETNLAEVAALSRDFLGRLQSS